MGWVPGTHVTVPPIILAFLSAFLEDGVHLLEHLENGVHLLEQVVFDPYHHHSSSLGPPQFELPGVVCDFIGVLLPTLTQHVVTWLPGGHVLFIPHVSILTPDRGSGSFLVLPVGVDLAHTSVFSRVVHRISTKCIVLPISTSCLRLLERGWVVSSFFLTCLVVPFSSELCVL